MLSKIHIKVCSNWYIQWSHFVPGSPPGHTFPDGYKVDLSPGRKLPQLNLSVHFRGKWVRQAGGFCYVMYGNQQASRIICVAFPRVWRPLLEAGTPEPVFLYKRYVPDDTCHATVYANHPHDYNKYLCTVTTVTYATSTQTTLLSWWEGPTGVKWL